ncbi:protein inscuteable homolog isoform X1 [Lingula anatina]|uniref:Protein inscuteable homolog isoform X1 n=3 Tax=Lingula anatina TaxID=7574 RepID=A0A1S3JUF5_LINAN|nr:protein inscuteable homolog isoform X1 [Lingula anatina]|eukprot:XP_013413958.1 protein inscuteable homolog isoform X1 [Lingula anatina]
MNFTADIKRQCFDTNEILRTVESRKMNFSQGGAQYGRYHYYQPQKLRWSSHLQSRVKLPTEIDSVQKWLSELRWNTESECMSVLQGKSLVTKQSHDSSTVSSAKSTKDRLDAIRSRAHVISAEFAKLFKKIEKERWKHIKGGACRITSQVRSLLHDINTSIQDMPPYLFEEEAVIIEESAKLAQYIDSLGEINGHKPNTLPLVNMLTTIGQSFSAVVDMALGYLIQQMIQSIEDATSPHFISASLSHLISLGLEGEHMCFLIAREGGVRVLFEVCRQSKFEFAHSQALRAIATVCCVSESILELEKAAGVECLTDILCNEGTTEHLRSEAAGVVAQITSPCLDHNQHISGFIENMEDLIQALLKLCMQTHSHEVFLLATAAIANITFMDSMACDSLMQFDAARIMIEACQVNKAESMFAKDQVATILANMAVLENCSAEITENNGMELLLHFLHQRPSPQAAEAERSACERVHQKAAIALTRLSKDAENAHIIVELGGIPRLVQLCRNITERNNSDGVLIACLAALRKIATVCGVQEFSAADIQQLIKPTLVDSYLICSQLEESFV